MTTSQTSFLSEIKSGKKIPLHKRAYFRERLKNNLYDLLVSEFQRQEREENLSKAELTRRIDSRPEQVTRWLGAPGNWTLDTVSDLLLGMGCEPVVELHHLDDLQKNYIGPEWLQPTTLNITTSPNVMEDRTNTVVASSGISAVVKWPTDERNRA